MAEVARRREWPSLKSLNSAENLKPSTTLVCRDIKIGRDTKICCDIKICRNLLVFLKKKSRNGDTLGPVELIV